MERTGHASPILTARKAGLVGCRECGRVHPPQMQTCVRCGTPLVSRDRFALQRVWAWLVAGLLLYIPANVYPMLRTATVGREENSTIVGGAIELIHHGSVGIALIVLVASIGIPMAKFGAIAYLALNINRVTRMNNHTRLVLFEIVEFIGRWSMIDVFVVAILSALVQLEFVATINPGPAAVCFALSVAFTMLSAQNFDPRLIWDLQDEEAA